MSENSKKIDCVVHAYILSDESSLKENDNAWNNAGLNSSILYTPYNITLYKNDVESQPDSRSVVKIPIPENTINRILKFIVKTLMVL